MKKQLSLKKIFGLMLVAITLSPGCLVVGHHHDDADCSQDCHNYEVCETYCDYWDCWDECWVETSCTTYCTETVVETTETVTGGECYNDADCAGGKICVNDQCTARDTTDRGKAGLCQTCETSADCSGANSKCINLNYDMASGNGQAICSTACTRDADCPADFECVRISAEAGAPAQCLPIADDAGKRTCASGEGLECVKAGDCSAGESCENNKCVKPDNVECTRDAQCGAGKTCQSNKCVAEGAGSCVTRSDCASGELCINSKCEKENSSCVFNSECNDGKCINGACRSACTANADCGSLEHCRQGICEPIECRRAADCGAGKICVDAMCADTCTKAEDCGTGFLCSQHGFCTKDPNVQCRSNAECGRDEVCNAGSCTTPCNCNQQCPTGNVCNTDTGLCEAPATQPPAQQCQDNCDCPSGTTCQSGQCK